MIKKLNYILILVLLLFIFSSCSYKKVYEKEDNIKLIPIKNKIYFGAFPDFGGLEDNVTKERIEYFNQLSNKKIAWAYFSQNWFRGIVYPKRLIHEIEKTNTIPFIRFMPRSNEEEFTNEKIFTMQNIIDGKFDNELKYWIKDAKIDYNKTLTPLLIDFAVEPNGNWFSWSGIFNGKGTLDKYGNLSYPDGPERYRDAYRHIINLFKKENVTFVTWFFHPDIYSNPNEDWNQPKYYYPGDEYIDWIGLSVYGPLYPKENYWDTFSEILKNRVKSIKEISKNKPIALLEFGVTDNHSLGKKDEWIKDAFKTILSNKYIDFKAISYWHENWEEDNDTALLRIDSSNISLNIFRNMIGNKIFISKLNFSNYQNKNNNDKSLYILNFLKGLKNLIK